MACLIQSVLIAVFSVACLAQNFEATVQLTHSKTKGNVVKGKKHGDKEIANLKDLQKFFPKIRIEHAQHGDEEKAKPGDAGPDGFTDSIAESLDDAQAELLVAGQDASKVCSRDIQKFCGKGAMHSDHPIHCLGLLKDEQRAKIHKLCRVHLQESLQFTCAQDMENIGCDPVMSSTIDCLTEGLDKIGQECRDQTRLVAKVIAKVNNAEINVTTKDIDGKTVTKVHDGVYNEGNWKCPGGFMEHHTHQPCCYYIGDCSERQKSNGLISSKFKCAQNQCGAAAGKWVLKDPEGMELAGHLCCPSKKNGIQTYVDHKDEIGNTYEVWYKDEEAAAAEAARAASGRSWLYLFVIAALLYWQRNRVVHGLNVLQQVAQGELNEVHIGGRSVELSNFVGGIFSRVKKHNVFDKDIVKVPAQQQADAAAGYGGL
jgi:hypothetical protein